MFPREPLRSEGLSFLPRQLSWTRDLMEEAGGLSVPGQNYEPDTFEACDLPLSYVCDPRVCSFIHSCPKLNTHYMQDPVPHAGGGGGIHSPSHPEYHPVNSVFKGRDTVIKPSGKQNDKP